MVGVGEYFGDGRCYLPGEVSCLVLLLLPAIVGSVTCSLAIITPSQLLPRQSPVLDRLVELCPVNSFAIGRQGTLVSQG